MDGWDGMGGYGGWVGMGRWVDGWVGWMGG